MNRLVRPVGSIALLAATIWTVAASCGESDPTRPIRTPTAIVKVAGDGQDGTAGTAVPIDPVIEVRDADGVPFAGVSVRFTTGGGGATTDTTITTGANGRASVAWLLGPTTSAGQTLSATAGTLNATFAATATAPVAGRSYFGRNGYVEYIPGDIPLIISAPHGGILTPSELPDRTGSITTVRDGNTEELARTFGNVFQTRTGERPHLIIMRLRRTKIDANREVVEAAQGHPLTERAWVEWHSFIETAKQTVTAEHGTGFYIDLHGHGHEIPRLELGYLLNRTTLALTDAALDNPTYENQSSIRTLSQASPATFPELLRGPGSLGALFEAEGFPAVPSPTNPNPGTAAYFDGGYNTSRHGSRNGGAISGVQVEAHFTGVRDTQASREAFAIALVRVWEQFWTGASALASSASGAGAP